MTQNLLLAHRCDRPHHRSDPEDSNSQRDSDEGERLTYGDHSANHFGKKQKTAEGRNDRHFAQLLLEHRATCIGRGTRGDSPVDQIGSSAKK
jgi:hypothetical protein